MNSKFILNAAIGTMAVAAIGLAWGSCNQGSSLSERVATVEHDLAYVFEVIRPRTVSAEHCESFSGGWKTCSLRGKELQCLCDYESDDWDKASFAFQVNAKAQELVDAMEAEAAKLAAEEEGKAKAKLTTEEGEGGDEGKE